MMNRMVLCGVVCLLLSVMVVRTEAGAVRLVEWSPHGAKVGCLMNMGPTGVRVWIRGFQFEVVTVDAGSPADGILMPGDRVIGVASTAFSAEADSRITLGNAIGLAEATDGALNLTVARDGSTLNLTVKLPVTGPFAASWPYGCAKSQRVLHEACESVLKAQFPSGEVVTDGGIGTFLSGLLLLSSGEARFMDGARRAAYATAAKALEDADTENWGIGYGGLLLAEYYLATGDATVLGRLKELADYLSRGQMRCGSWGHAGPAGGYGAMNQAGIICAITLVLAQECGVEVDPVALNRALAFYGQYAELGAVPYGDHAPGLSIPDDNGKSASTSILCSLHPEWEGAASVFAQSVAMSYWQRETGHTGGLFSLVWGPLACAMAGKDQFRTFMTYQEWFYNLCRTWRGDLVMLPYVEALTRFDDSGYTSFGGEFTTAGMALTFALPHHKLRILGAPHSVFGAVLSGPLQEARQCYLDRRWDAFNKAVAEARRALLPVRNAASDQERWIAQLEAAAEMLKATASLTRREIENNLNEGDAFRASEQFLALKRLLGGEDETIRALEPRFEDSTVKWYVRSGGGYYQAWNQLRAFAFQSWVPYGDMAKAHVGEVPELRQPRWETLSPVSGDVPREWSKRGEGGAVSGRVSFDLSTADYTDLRLLLRSPRNAHTQVYLNGTLVVDAVRGQRSDYAKINLDKTALSLLKAGANELSIDSTSVGSEGNALDVGIDGVLRTHPLAMTPAWQDGKPVGDAVPAVLSATLEKARCTFAAMPIDEPPADPSVPERLRVGESMKRFQAALDVQCDAMGPDALGVALRSPVAYWRHLAAKSLARRGEAGLRIAIDGLNDKDWRVRSACCDAISFAVAAAAVDAATVARLAALLADENVWVRCRAAGTLGTIGPAGVAAAPALVRATIDPNEWVRSAALGAMAKVTDDARVLVAAAVDSLQVPGTSFSQLNRSFGLIEKYGVHDTSVIPALVFALEHPGEGDGSQRYSQVMAMLVELDPDGKIAAPVLAKVAAGGYAYDRLRGNLRKAAIDNLGGDGHQSGGGRAGSGNHYRRNRRKNEGSARCRSDRSRADHRGFREGSRSQRVGKPTPRGSGRKRVGNFSGRS